MIQINSALNKILRFFVTMYPLTLKPIKMQIYIRYQENNCLLSLLYYKIYMSNVLRSVFIFELFEVSGTIKPVWSRRLAVAWTFDQYSRALIF